MIEILMPVLIALTTEAGKEYIKSILPVESYRLLKKSYRDALKEWSPKNRGVRSKKESLLKYHLKLIHKVIRNPEEEKSLNRDTQEIIALFRNSIISNGLGDKFLQSIEISNISKNISKNNELLDKILISIQDLRYNDEIKSTLKEILQVLENDSDLDYDNYYDFKIGNEVIPEDLIGSLSTSKKEAFYEKYFRFDRETLDNTLLKNVTGNLNTLIVGKHLSGKTRAIVQLFNNNFKEYNIIIPKKKMFINKEIYNIKFPSLNEKCIWIFDNINEYFLQDPKDIFNFNELLNSIICDKNSLIIATCTKQELSKISNTIINDSLIEFNTIKIPRVTKKQHYKLLQEYQLDENVEHDDTIGSYFISLNILQRCYNELSEVSKILLRSYKVTALYCANRGYKREIEKYSSISSSCCKEFKVADWQKYYDELEYSGFISIYNKGDRIFVEPVYIEKFIEPNSSELSLAKEALEYFPSVENYTKTIQQLQSYKNASIIFSIMNKSECEPNIITYNVLLNKTFRFYKAMKIFSMMLKNNLCPNEITYTILINKCQNNKQFKRVLNLINKSEIELKDITYFTSLINKTSNFTEALSIYKIVLENDVKPNKITFTSLINKCEKYKDSQLVLELMDQFSIKPDIITFNCILNSCQSYLECKNALKLLNSKDFEPNNITYRIIANKCNNKADAINFIRYISENGKNPDTFIATSLIKACNDFNEADTVYLSLKELGSKFDVIFYTAFLQQTKEFDNSLKVLDYMEANNFKPDLHTINTLLDKCNSYKKANEILNQTLASGFKPDIYTFTNIMKTTRNYANMINTYNIMKRYNIAIDSYIIFLILRSCEKQLQKNKTVKLLEQHNIKPNSYIFKELIRLSNNFEEGMGIQKQMEHSNITFNEHHYRELIKKASSSNEIKMVNDLLNYFELKPSPNN